MAATVRVEEHDMGWKRIQKELKHLHRAYTKVGFFGNGGAPDVNIAARAAVNEYGAKIRVTTKMRWWWLFNTGTMLKKRIIRIPKRPFMRFTFERNVKRTKKWLEAEYDKILKGEQTAKKAMGAIGEHWAGFIVTTMRRRSLYAPNVKIQSSLTRKQKARMKKGGRPAHKFKRSSTPLADTGEMRKAVTHREKV